MRPSLLDLCFPLSGKFVHAEFRIVHVLISQSLYIVAFHFIFLSRSETAGLQAMRLILSGPFFVTSFINDQSRKPDVIEVVQRVKGQALACLLIRGAIWLYEICIEKLNRSF